MPDSFPDAAPAPFVQEQTPSLQEQTIELGRTFKDISDNAPLSTPSPLSAQVFADWLAQAGPTSRQPERMADVLHNYDVLANTNRDLFDLFTMLQSYIEVPDDDPEDDLPARTWIGLPLLGAAPPAPQGE